MTKLKKYTDLMIDLETLDTKNSTVVLSIGAVCFNYETGEIGPKFYCTLSRDEQIVKGRTISNSTLKWWESQNEEAQDVLVKSQLDTIPVGAKLQVFYNFVKANTSKVRAWANSPSFDLEIMKHILNQYDIKVPWLFYNERDVRTFRHVKANNDKINRTEGIHHNALSDALAQVNFIVDYI